MQWLVIKLSALDTQSPAYCLLDKKIKTHSFIHASWEQLAAQKYKHCIVLIPSRDVTLNTVELPTKSYSKLQKAIPYALENELADDIKILHFSFHRPRSKTSTSTQTAAIKRSRLDQWLQLLQEHQIKPHYLLPDLFALPVTPEGYSIAINDEQAIIREGIFSGFSCHTSMLPVLLDEQRKRVSNQDHPILQGLGVNPEYNAELTDICSPDLIDALPLNLLQGLDGSEQNTLRKIPYLKSISTLALLCITLWIGQTFIHNQGMSNKIDQLHQKINTIFHETLPKNPIDNDYRILNAQMKESLKAYSHHTQTKHTSPLILLYSIAPKLAKSSITLTKINYDMTGLYLTLTAHSISEIDNLLQQLPPAISAKRTSSNISANQVQATILINSVKP